MAKVSKIEDNNVEVKTNFSVSDKLPPPPSPEEVARKLDEERRLLQEKQEAERRAYSEHQEAKKVKLELVRLAKEVLIENSRSKAVDERDVSASDITAYASSLFNYVNE